MSYAPRQARAGRTREVPLRGVGIKCRSGRSKGTRAAHFTRQAGTTFMTPIEEMKRPRHGHIFQRDENDRYVEPTWCSWRLLEEKSFHGAIHDPAAGTGQNLGSARALGLRATGADLTPCISGIRAIDFFKDRTKRDNIVCNPLYNGDQIRKFAEHALELAERKVALLVPLARLNAAHWLLQTPLQYVWLLTPRPSVPPHSCILQGRKPEGGRADFCWLVWERGFSGAPTLGWLLRDRVS